MAQSYLAAKIRRFLYHAIWDSTNHMTDSLQFCGNFGIFHKNLLRNGKDVVYLQRNSSPKGFLLRHEKTEHSVFFIFPIPVITVCQVNSKH